MQATSRGAIAAEVVFCIGVALVVHVVTHWRWVVGITRQLLHKLPVRTRVYYALDATLLVAFASIISSGVMMSTAVLPLFGAQGRVNLTVVQVHRVAAYLALAWLGMKFVLHRTWLKNAIRRHVVGVLHAVPEPAFRSPALMPVPTTSGNTAKVISRRRFLLIGCSAVGVVWLAIINQTRQAQGDALITPTETPPDDAPAAIVAAPVDTPTTPTAIAELVEPISTPIAAVVETVEPTALPTAAAPQRTATRCPRGKVNDPYPGHCRHYVDQNGNGICDLSETA